MSVATYHDDLLHGGTDQISNGPRDCLAILELDLQAHEHVPVEEQIGEPEPLRVELFDRRRIPPVLVEFTVREQGQLGQRVREGLEQEENHEHDLQDQGHLELQVELEDACVLGGAHNRNDVFCHNHVLHELEC